MGRHRYAAPDPCPLSGSITKSAAGKRSGKAGQNSLVVTPELQSENQIGADPLPPGQVWAIGPGVRILNNPAPATFRESVRYAEQNLYTRVKELVGD